MDLHSNNSFYKAKEKDYLFRIKRLSWKNEEKKLNPEKFITIFVSKREMIRAKKLAMVNANYQVKAQDHSLLYFTSACPSQKEEE